MSRLESNAEPSMEEILASIRKIIAEDSSGLRSPAAPARPGAPYTPAPRSATPTPSPSPMPQRGFMSREAFLKSSQVAEPSPVEDRPEAPRALGGDVPGAPLTSRLRPRDEKPISESPFPSLREREGTLAREPLRAREDLRPRDLAAPAEPLRPATLRAEPQPPKDAPASSPVETIAADSETIREEAIESIETVEVVAVEDALPMIDGDAPAILAAETVPAAHSKVESDTARIEAQLTELLSEDLNALRQGRTKAAASEALGDVDATKAAPAAVESNDPFAFDLGPSPFASKPEPLQPVVAAPVTPPIVTAPVMPAPVAKAEPVAPSPSPLQWQAPEPAAPPAPAAAAPDVPPVNAAPVAATPPSATPAPKPRQTFIVPSVSATIGPSRKLEPLSNAFQPVPPPPPSVMESFSPIAEPAPSIARNSPSDETVVRSGLPATASDSVFDRPMEDAVADLLRPLLKTWLAENMPKIVERALRREMSERLLPGQKNPLD